MTKFATDDLRIQEKKGLIPPVIMLDELPLTENASMVVHEARQAIHNILYGVDDRLLILVGPCSIHDHAAALEYGQKLIKEAQKHQNELLVVMRVYFEKPRTTVGWKGYINDPDLDGSFKINKGLHMARKLLLDLNQLGLPCGTEFLDVISPQYLADLISWGAIGARTTESQVHRELASGLSAPIGFKNGTDGSLQIAVDAIRAARSSHHFLSVTKQGSTAIFTTKGNEDTHVILRGGKQATNYDADSISQSINLLRQHDLPAKVMVDCSHGNSQKNHENQPGVAREVGEQIANGSEAIMGLMIESHLQAGNQPLSESLVYGQSITDACIGWSTTVEVLNQLADAVKRKRKAG